MISPLAQDHTIVYRSPDNDGIHCYSPGLVCCPDGRLIATCDLGGTAVAQNSGPKYDRGERGWTWQGKIFTSDDGGNTWQNRANFPFMHARPFVTGNAIYVLGHAGDLMIVRSDDGGVTWSEPAALTEGQFWHQAPCNVHYANGYVYLVMERRITSDIQTWYVGELAPVLLRGSLETDLRERSNWTFASELSFRDALPQVETDPAIDYFGVPFYECPYPQGTTLAPGRNCAPIGWLETNVVQIHDPDHYWHDPSGHTLHLWMRAHTGGTGYAAVAKVIEQDDGIMTTMLEKAPSGKQMLYVPCPGGQMKFHVLYDDQSRMYWLLSSQATGSMTRTDRLPPDRYNLPNNERHRLQLHFSTNMIDWCFAGLVTMGPSPRQARHYASMVVDGDDLHILSRSGDERAANAHDGNMITFHSIRDFRALVY
jgi:hypothetical protein